GAAASQTPLRRACAATRIRSGLRGPPRLGRRVTPAAGQPLDLVPAHRGSAADPAVTVSVTGPYARGPPIDTRATREWVPETAGRSGCGSGRDRLAFCNPQSPAEKQG